MEVNDLIRTFRQWNSAFVPDFMVADEGAVVAFEESFFLFGAPLFFTIVAAPAFFFFFAATTFCASPPTETFFVSSIVFREL